MKKILPILSISLIMFSCNNGGGSAEGNDTTATENPTAIEDTGTQHATGITNSNVISTDTSKFDVKPVPKDSTPKK